MASNASFKTGVSDWIDLGTGPMIVQCTGDGVYVSVADTKPAATDAGLSLDFESQPISLNVATHVWSRSREHASTVVATLLSGSGALASQTAPVNSAPVAISAPGAAGSTVSGTAGTWTGSPTLTYQWYEENTLGEYLHPLSGQQSINYVVSDRDAGKMLLLAETAVVSPYFTRTVFSAPAVVPVPAVAPAAYPILITPPSIYAPNLAIGSSITVTQGVYGNYDAIVGQFRRDGNVINGASGTSYTLAQADLGARITYSEIVSKGSNTISVTSKSVGKVLPAPAAPTNTVLPRVSGVAAVGNTLTAIPGVWVGTPTPVVTGQWNIAGAPVAGQTGQTYVIQPGDAGNVATYVETAVNTSGSNTATSLPTASIAAAPTQVPGVISNLTPTPTANTINLLWNAPVTGGTVVQYSVRSRVQGTTDWTTALTGSDAVAATITGLAQNTTYEVQVAGVNGVGTGAYSSSVTGTTTSSGGQLSFDDPGNSGLISVL